MSTDLYAILEVERSASARQIRSAYRRLARAYHPDRNTEDDAADSFKRVAEAYAVLSDTSRRAAYDQWGHTSATETSVTYDDDGDFAFE
jgi:DnaJ-class molecular chaperone